MNKHTDKPWLLVGALLSSPLSLFSMDFVSADSVTFTPTVGNGATVYGSLTRIIDGSGLTEINGNVSQLTEANIQSVAHTRGYNASVQYINADGDLTEGDFDFTFYSPISLSDIYIWNFSHGQVGSSLNLRGVGAYEIYINTGSGFEGPVTVGTLGESSPVHRAQKIDLGSIYTDVIAVRVAATQLVGGSYNALGLDEVVFGTTPSGSSGGDLTVAGNLDILGGSIIIGEDSSGQNGTEGAGITFTDAVSGEATQTNFLGYRDQHQWLWQLAADSGVPETALKLTEDGELSLFDPTNSNYGLTLTPYSNKLSFNNGGTLGSIEFNGSDFITHDGTSLTQGGGTGASGISHNSADDSISWGYGSASTSLSTAWGYSYANGDASTAWGDSNDASASYSTVWGQNNYADSYLSTAFGRYSTGLGNSTNKTTWVETDPLLEVGNGDHIARSNALTILKNGQTTLANKGWKTELEGSDPLGTPTDVTNTSAGEALVVEGHARFRGKISVEHYQGDISMGAFGAQ